MRRSGTLSLVLLALLLGLLPPGYGAIFGLAYQNDIVSKAEYHTALSFLELLMSPGRALLWMTPYREALRTTHLPFWKGLIAATLGNSLAWLIILGAISWTVRRLMRLPPRKRAEVNSGARGP